MLGSEKPEAFFLKEELRFSLVPVNIEDILDNVDAESGSGSNLSV